MMGGLLLDGDLGQKCTENLNMDFKIIRGVIQTPFLIDRML